MALSKDPSRRATQLENLAKGRQKLAERVAAGDPPAPKRRTKPSVMQFDPPPKEKRAPRKPAAASARRARSERDTPARGKRRGGGFLDGLLGRHL